VLLTALKPNLRQCEIHSVYSEFPDTAFEND
jgi:hypothetical protein